MSLLDYRQLGYYSSWTECSRDDSHNVSMIVNENQVVNFDMVKTRYLNDLGLSEESAASVDALGEDSEGHVYLIEFKNGDINQDEIRNKVFESILIYNDITSSSLKDTREKMDFILVYNSERKKYQPLQLKAMHLARIGKCACPYYGLDKYHGFCVKHAYMVDADHFTNKILGKLHCR